MKRPEPMPREDWLKLKQAVHERDHYRCRALLPNGRPCMKGPPDIQIQCAHVIPRSKGGPDTVNNCITKCLDCHAREHPWMLKYQRGKAKNMAVPIQMRGIKDALNRASIRQGATV